MSIYTEALRAQLAGLLGPMFSWPWVHAGQSLTREVARKARVAMQTSREEILLVYFSYGDKKPSVVVTDAALYLSDPFVRIEHARLQWPAQPGNPPVFPLAEGPLALGNRIRDDNPTVAIFGTAWTAIVNANQEAGPPKPVPFEVPGPLAAHARSILVSPKIRVGPTNMRADALIYDAVAMLGSGVDPFAQETPLAIIADPDDISELVLLTDQRLLAVTPNGPVYAPYAALTTVQPGGKGLISASITMHAQGAVQVLKLEKLMDEAQLLGRFLFDLTRAPPHERRAPPVPFNPGADDPTGAKAALATDAGADPQLGVVFDAILGALARNELSPAVGRDLVERARLAYRMEQYARGMYQGMWISPLPPTDLACLCGRVLGPSSNVAMDPSGALMGEFVLRGPGPTGADLGKAAVSTAAGLAVGLLFGVGWVSVPRGPRVTRVRALIRPAPWGSGFMLSNEEYGGSKPLTQASPFLFAKLDEALSKGEQQLLFLRSLYGWNADPNALLSLTAEAVSARVRELTGDGARIDVFREGASTP